MKKVFLFVCLFSFAAMQSFAAGVHVLSAEQASIEVKKDPSLALDPLTQQAVDKVMNADSRPDASKKELSISKKIQQKIQKVSKKIKDNKAPKDDLARLLTTIGLILIIVGLVMLVLGLVLSGGVYYGSGGGLLVLGLILYLVGKYAL
jgi:Flp pilus assembly protein TadB